MKGARAKSPKLVTFSKPGNAKESWTTGNEINQTSPKEQRGEPRRNATAVRTANIYIAIVIAARMINSRGGQAQRFQLEIKAIRFKLNPSGQSQELMETASSAHCSESLAPLTWNCVAIGS